MPAKKSKTPMTGAQRFAKYGGGVEDQGLGRVGLQWNQAAEGDPESPPHGGLDPNEIEFLLNLTNNLVRFLEKVQ